MNKKLIFIIRYLNAFMILIGCPVILIILANNEIITHDESAWIYFILFIISWLGIANNLNKIKVDE